MDKSLYGERAFLSDQAYEALNQSLYDSLFDPDLTFSVERCKMIAKSYIEMLQAVGSIA